MPSQAGSWRGRPVPGVRCRLPRAFRSLSLGFFHKLLTCTRRLRSCCGTRLSAAVSLCLPGPRGSEMPRGTREPEAKHPNCEARAARPLPPCRSRPLPSLYQPQFLHLGSQLELTDSVYLTGERLSFPPQHHRQVGRFISQIPGNISPTHTRPEVLGSLK